VPKLGSIPRQRDSNVPEFRLFLVYDDYCAWSASWPNQVVDHSSHPGRNKPVPPNFFAEPIVYTCS